MASAIIGGLVRQGWPTQQIEVVEPWEEQRARLAQQFGVRAQATPGTRLSDSRLVVWAVKPQTFEEAALGCQDLLADALHLSVAAGIRSDSISTWLGTDKIVRAMPNTPALLGCGASGLFANSTTSANNHNQEQQCDPQLLMTFLFWSRG